MGTAASCVVEWTASSTTGDGMVRAGRVRGRARAEAIGVTTCQEVTGEACGSGQHGTALSQTVQGLMTMNENQHVTIWRLRELLQKETAPAYLPTTRL